MVCRSQTAISTQGAGGSGEAKLRQAGHRKVTADWYDEHADGGGDFLGAVDEAVEDIATAPWRWAVVKGMSPSTRRCLMKRYPYSVFDRVDAQGVLIVSIAHQSREPLYWLGR